MSQPSNSEELLPSIKAAAKPPLQTDTVGGACVFRSNAGDERGFSLVELCVVVGLIVILTAMAIFARGHRELYRTEDQALQVVNLMRRAGQKAITDRQSMRFEIDLTDGVARVIDENGTLATGNDTQVAQVQLDKNTEVRMNLTTSNISRPSNVATTPGQTPSPAFEPHPAVTFASASGGSLKWTIYFHNDGTVTYANNAPVSETLMLWQPVSAADPNNAKSLGTVRAITISGGSSAVRYWKYNGTTFVRG